MAENTLHVTISTPSKCLLDVSDVLEIYFPGAYGILGVFPAHAPLITTIGTGIVVYNQHDVAGIFKVTGGIAEIADNSVTLLVDIAEEATSIDIERAKRSLERAESRLLAKSLDNVDVKRAETAKARALARMEAVNTLQNKQSAPSKK